MKAFFTIAALVAAVSAVAVPAELAPKACLPEGAKCTGVANTECCSQWCDNGGCGKDPNSGCHATGAQCRRSSECCSGVCHVINLSIVCA